jgi:redox-sensitive bicupin YhaK (pirin superfamily)
MVASFIFLDHLGCFYLPKALPREADTLPQPHVGLSTVTYLFATEIIHAEPVRGEQAIQSGEMN